MEASFPFMRRRRARGPGSIEIAFIGIAFIDGDGPGLGAGVVTQAIGSAPVPRILDGVVTLMVEEVGRLETSRGTYREAQAAALALLLVDFDPTSGLGIGHERLQRTA